MVIVNLYSPTYLLVWRAHISRSSILIQWYNKIISLINDRWDEEAVEQCPTYLRTLYVNILTTVKAIEEWLNLQNNKHAKLVKRLVCIAETTRLKWRNNCIYH